MVLVQEMNVKVDKELIISLASLFSQQSELLDEVLIVYHGSARSKLLWHKKITGEQMR